MALQHGDGYSADKALKTIRFYVYNRCVLEGKKEKKLFSPLSILTHLTDVSRDF